MSDTITLSLTDVVIIYKTVKSTRERTRREAWVLLQLTLKRLKADGEGRLALAADVRAPKAAVVAALRKVYRLAHAQWKAAKAAEAANAASAPELVYEADPETGFLLYV